MGEKYGCRVTNTAPGHVQKHRHIDKITTHNVIRKIVREMCVMLNSYAAANNANHAHH